jgi:osmoprotectant transport system ATP-binding protein
VARALAADPDLLLMDEPFGALDPGTRSAIHDEFLSLQARIRKTVVLVTHDLVEAGKLADDIVLLDGGRIVQRGTIRDLLLHPVDERVRVFLGPHSADLALNLLRLGQIMDDSAPRPSGTPVVRLNPHLSLGQALAALAAANDSTVVEVGEGAAGRAYSAQDLRTRILAVLKGCA